jgi:type 2 lantibiotic biosynthesis protein LanM
MVDAYLDAAAEIGFAICRDAVWHEDRCTWISAAVEPLSRPPRYFFRTVGADFYDGTAGIGFFLGHLSRYLQDPIIRRTAEGALRQTVVSYGEIPEHSQLGFFTGYSGIAYVLFSMGHALENPRLIDEARTLVKKIVNTELPDKSLDVIGGVAGAIPALITIYSMYPEASLKQYILELGEHLIRTAEMNAAGWSWKTLSRTTRNLTGYSHGSAGFTQALLELWVFSSEKKYLEAAYRSREYENSLFDPGQQNWLDVRVLDDNPLLVYSNAVTDSDCSCFWCHGAPGIGQSRQKAYRITNDQVFLNDLETALQTTIRETTCNGQNNGFSLCHGVLGNAELLLNAHDLSASSSSLERVKEIGGHVIENYLSQDIPIPNGIGNDFQIPCFMTGLAGMGYFFLRCHNASLFPSILALELGPV